MKTQINGKDVYVSILGGFVIDELEKEYVLCSYDDDVNSDKVIVAILETNVNENGDKILVSIPDDEKEIVLNFYKSFKASLLEGGE